MAKKEPGEQKVPGPAKWEVRMTGLWVAQFSWSLGGADGIALIG